MQNLDMGSMQSNKKHTSPLDGWHRDMGATMGEFSSYTLPLWYESVKNEHLAVLKSAGLFDTCHMAAILATGHSAFTVLQNTFSKDLSNCGKKSSSLPLGKGVYGVFLRENGHLIDDAIIFRLEEETYLICVNSGMGEIITRHLQSNSPQKVAFENLTGKMVKIDLQGPNAARILSHILESSDKVFNSFSYFSCKGEFLSTTCGHRIATQSGIPIFLARSGYTGEFGFELFTPQEHVVQLWQEIINAGKDYQLIPCGLAARDSLRTGAVLPLAGHDIGTWPFHNTPWDFALPYDIKGNFTKSFIGDTAIQTWAKYTYAYAGYDPRKIEAGPKSKVINDTDQVIGQVLTCASDMATARIEKKLVSINSSNLPNNFISRGISCGYVLIDSKIPYGSEITLQDTRRKIKVEIVSDIRPARSARLPMSQFI